MVNDGTLAASSILARDSSTITIVGDGFEVDGAPVPFGDLTALQGTLTGTLQSGNSFLSLFYQRGASCAGLPCTGTITLVPERAPFLLLGLGLTGLAVRSRRGSP